jgi:DNA mismatch repair protein MutS
VKDEAKRERAAGGAEGRGENSPAMKQFFRCKGEYPDALLFFRMGDFYELFFEDAVIASKALDLTLTSRSKSSGGEDIPMAGVPHHAAAGYLARLMEQGFKVAICEQMADPKTVKGVVPREVVRVVTPGLALDPDALDARTDNLVVAVAAGGQSHALAALELSRAEVRGCVLSSPMHALGELLRLDPREVVLDASSAALEDHLRKALPRARIELLRADAGVDTEVAPEIVDAAHASPLLRRALSHVVTYAQASQPKASLRLGQLVTYDPAHALGLDEVAVRNLELVKTLSGERVGSLLHLLDETKTPMGSRTLRRRLLAPLSDLRDIERRLDRVEALAREPVLRGEVRSALDGVGDLERLATRAELGLATPLDLGALSAGLARAQRAQSLLANAPRGLDGESPLAGLGLADACGDLKKDIAETLVDEPPFLATQGGLVRDGVDAALDELRQIGSRAKDLLIELEQKERSASAIASLKIRYTKVFGYYVEVTRPNLHLVPKHFRRKQTVANGERFTTDALDELADKILHAEERARALEQEIFEALRRRIGGAAQRLRRWARFVSDVDVDAALAEVAQRRGYVRPQLTESPVLELTGARHPVVETLAAAGTFVPNDLSLDAGAERLAVITGPNMAGKSTAMRQAALAVILAQMGSFVPADAARIGLCDRIYTRVGASDNLSRGESTFMVEMRETAALLLGATTRSLVVLDEIGRGTSTYDGLAIAWAVAEHLVDQVRCRALFATHYHELCELEAQRPGLVANWNVAAREKDGDIVFLHRLMRGPSHRSYGIAVANLAGLPERVVQRSKQLLDALEQRPQRGTLATARAERPQLAMSFGEPTVAEPPRSVPVDPLRTELEKLDPNAMTPLEALNALARLRALPRS